MLYGLFFAPLSHTERRNILRACYVPTFSVGLPINGSVRIRKQWWLFVSNRLIWAQPSTGPIPPLLWLWILVGLHCNGHLSAVYAHLLSNDDTLGYIISLGLRVDRRPVFTAGLVMDVYCTTADDFAWLNLPFASGNKNSGWRCDKDDIACFINSLHCTIPVYVHDYLTSCMCDLYIEYAYANQVKSSSFNTFKPFLSNTIFIRPWCKVVFKYIV